MSLALGVPGRGTVTFIEPDKLTVVPRADVRIVHVGEPGLYALALVLVGVAKEFTAGGSAPLSVARRMLASITEHEVDVIWSLVDGAWSCTPDLPDL